MKKAQFTHLPSGYGFMKWWYYSANFKHCYVARLENTQTMDFFKGEEPTQRAMIALRHRVIANGKRYKVGEEPRR